MSFRTAYRRLRANGSDFGWGSRLTLTVRIPLDAFTVPCPAPSAELAAHLEGYEPTGCCNIGKKFGDGSVDPPYNQHPYGSNYFMLNIIAKNEFPSDVSDVSGIPNDWNRSAYNKRRLARIALNDIATSVDAKFLLISFNSEGFVSRDEMVAMLERLGKVEVLETTYNVFRGSRNLSERNIHVTEYLYLVEKS